MADLEIAEIPYEDGAIHFATSGICQGTVPA